MSEAPTDAIQLDPSDENRNYSTPLLEEQEESILEQFETEESLDNKTYYSFHNLFRKYDFAKSSRTNETKGIFTDFSSNAQLALQRVLTIWQVLFLAFLISF